MLRDTAQMGTRNVGVLQRVLLEQKLMYEIPFSPPIEVNTDIPVLVLSHTNSVLPVNRRFLEAENNSSLCRCVEHLPLWSWLTVLGGCTREARARNAFARCATARSPRAAPSMALLPCCS